MFEKRCERRVLKACVETLAPRLGRAPNRYHKPFPDTDAARHEAADSRIDDSIVVTTDLTDAGRHGVVLEASWHGMASTRGIDPTRNSNQTR